MKNKNKPSRTPFCIEALEDRKMMSASPAIHADSTVATTTSLTITNRTAEIGQSVTIKGVIKASNGAVDKGATVELLEAGKDTGLTATVNHLGYVTFTFGPGNAEYVGTQQWRMRVLTNGSFEGSKSRQLTAKVTSPSLTTESDGLELATVTKGTGAAAKANQTVTVEYTGWNAANGEEFDDSAAHSPGTFSFILEDSTQEQVIAGFDQEVAGMKVGETRVAYIPVALAYPASDTSVSVAGDNLVFVVHLVSIS
jgi:peptidylprolyl isomerase